MENNSESKHKVDSKVKKLFFIFVTFLIMLLPIAFIYGIISDRANYREQAVQKVKTSWAGEQTIGIPLLYFTEKVKDQKDEVKRFFSLNNYDVQTKVITEIRTKGIFKVPVYIAEVTLKGDFTNFVGNLSTKNLILDFNVSDAKGFVEEPTLKIGNQPTKTLHMTYTNLKLSDAPEIIPFEITYKIKGLNKINIDVAGMSNTVSMQSNWKAPSFEGNYLPITRELTNQGFSAKWSIPNVAIPKNEDISLRNSACVSVSLLIPVDSYTMADRALKYSYLLLILSFLCYFVFEITSKEEKRIHPIQYCLLGAAVLIFYFLLVSISELLPFLHSYIISAAMILMMIFLYTHFVVTKKQNLAFSFAITFLMALLYTFFYVLLQLQDIALLAGSLALFLIISAVMYFTRNVDWYGEN